MDVFAQFQESLREALTHLYDPTYHPPELLHTLLGTDPLQGSEAVQTAIVQAIGALQPAPTVPTDARSRRIYDVLFCRYVKRLTQEETAERLSITPRHLRREQQQAVSVLAWQLWRCHHVAPAPSIALDDKGEQEIEEGSVADEESAQWRSQVRQELAALQKSAPGSVSDVAAALRGAVELAQTLAASRDVRLVLGAIESDLIVPIHLSALRQVLIKCLTELMRHMSAGEIVLAAAHVAGQIEVKMTGSPLPDRVESDDYLISELLSMEGGSIRLDVSGNSLCCRIELLAADRVTVLVVDDNADLVHFYQRYATGTRYLVVGLAEGKQVLQTVEAMEPDIIVLDVMLPDMDGWELLTLLHAQPSTRMLPIVVCSVVREEELALALGATLYVPKPVSRRQFIQALDKALSRVVPKGPTISASNVPAG